MEGVIGGAFAKVLTAERERFNAMFLHARRESPALNGDQFLSFLRSTMDPLITTAATTHPQLVTEITVLLYDTSLTLFRRSLIGPDTRHPEFASDWSRLLGHILALPQLDPKLLIAPLTNALHHVFYTPGCRTEDWVTRMTGTAVNCTDASQLLQVGQVLAWTAGMVQYRSAALALARRLPAPVVASIFREDAKTGLATVELLDRLEASPWSTGHMQGTLKLVCVA